MPALRPAVRPHPPGRSRQGRACPLGTAEVDGIDIRCIQIFSWNRTRGGGSMTLPRQTGFGLDIGARHPFTTPDCTDDH